MIDWWVLFHNFLWVVGLAVVLGAMSMANYEAQRATVRLWHKLRESGFQLWFSVGMALFCTGLALGAGAWWENVIWGLLALASAAKAARLCCRRRA
jgi:hypothetical protein